MSDRDYYEILGLTPRADGAMVDASYWHLVRKYQALAATNPHAQRLIDELNEAYGVLGNPRLRQQYDAFRDDVLIRSGMIQPVASTPKRSKQKPGAAADGDQAAKSARHPKSKKNHTAGLTAAVRKVTLPKVKIQHGRTYLLGGIIALLAFAAAWQGVNIILVAVALAGGLALALGPTLKRRIGDLNFDIPSVSVPRVNFGEITAIRDLTDRDDPAIDADVLRQSTAVTISRWRQSIGLRVHEPEDVVPADVVEDLRIAAQEDAPVEPGSSEPLDAVMHILRHGASRSATH